MKCLILAGGSGDTLWPLSRKQYPKQFMAINENRSLLQETVVRNLPFCEEFFIVTSQAWHFIAEGQLHAFQGLRYRCFLEGTGRGTAAAIALVCMQVTASELIYVVSADTIIEGPGYADGVLQAKELARKGAMVAFGVPAAGPRTGYGYIRHKDGRVLSFSEKPDRETAEDYLRQGDYVWHTGSFLFRSGDFLRQLELYAPRISRACREALKKQTVEGRKILWPAAAMESIPAASVEKAVFERCDNWRVVLTDAGWKDIGSLEDLEQTPLADTDRHIGPDCRNVTVINGQRDHLVVTNGLEDAVVVHTPDATYVGKKGRSDAMKEIVAQNWQQYRRFFDQSPVAYRPYGTYQVLVEESGYRVKKVYMYPGCAIGVHRHRYRSEHWSVAAGQVRISLEQPAEGGDTVLTARDYGVNESIYVPVGMLHKVENVGQEPAVIIEVAIGSTLGEQDIDRVEDRAAAAEPVTESVIPLKPAFQDYLWGGTALKDRYGKESDLPRLAESWELSAHPAGQSVIAAGRYAGLPLGEYFRRTGKKVWGWKCGQMDRFPILIKFIDAREDLSVQLHPGDDYALTHEGEYGKNELWHVLDAGEDAAIYYGFSGEVTVAEIRKRLEAGTLTEILKRVPVKPGDTFFIPAGTVHAILHGILLCEVQQNSNVTYRLDDYGRKDDYGQPRPLHISRALEVLAEEPLPEIHTGPLEPETHEGYTSRLLGSCKYFETVRYDVRSSVTLFMDASSFLSVIVLEGSGVLQTEDTALEMKAGDSFFLPAGEQKVQAKGTCVLLVTHV